jgi:hypothetical protein
LRMSLPPRTFLRSCMVKMKFSAIVGSPGQYSGRRPGQAPMITVTRCEKAARRSATRETGCRQVHTMVVSRARSDLDLLHGTSGVHRSKQAGTGAG